MSRSVGVQPGTFGSCRGCEDRFERTGTNHVYCSPVCRDKAKWSRLLGDPVKRAHTYLLTTLRKYGLSEEAYDQMIARQEGACALCGRPYDKPNVDHNHTTGEVRDLLCTLCNLGLGAFLDSPELLEQAAVYLRVHDV
jgi:hypothetical protein